MFHIFISSWSMHMYCPFTQQPPLRYHNSRPTVPGSVLFQYAAASGPCPREGSFHSPGIKSVSALHSVTWRDTAWYSSNFSHTLFLIFSTVHLLYFLRLQDPLVYENRNPQVLWTIPHYIKCSVQYFTLEHRSIGMTANLFPFLFWTPVCHFGVCATVCLFK